MTTEIEKAKTTIAYKGNFDLVDADIRFPHEAIESALPLSEYKKIAAGTSESFNFLRGDLDRLGITAQIGSFSLDSLITETDELGQFQLEGEESPVSFAVLTVTYRDEYTQDTETMPWETFNELGKAKQIGVCAQYVAREKD